MKYKIYDKKSYKLHLIKTNNFKTFFVKFVFRNLLKEEEITIRNFLMEIISSSTKKYNTTRLLNIKQQELYDLSIHFTSRRVGKQIMSELCFSFIDKKYSSKDIIKDVMDFIYEVIFNPNVSDNKFNEPYFKITYDYLEERIKESLKNPNFVASLEAKKLMAKDNPFSYNLNGNLDDLKKITNENLYSYYKKFINEDLLDIFVVGDLNYKEMEPYFDKIIDIKTIKKDNLSFVNKIKDNKLKKEVKPSNFKQSKLVVLCKINSDELSKNQVLLYNMILGNHSESKLFKNVREKYSLCYDITSSYYRWDNTIIIESGINKDAFEKVVKQIELEMNNISSGKFSKKHLQNCKTYVLSTIKSFKDYPYSISEYYFNLNNIDHEDIETKIKNISKITKEDIINVSKKISIDTIYLLKEDDNNETN